MTEKTFHRELAGCLRKLGWMIFKWPDQAVSAMRVSGDGKLRFATPKPCDLMGCDESGRFVAVECKLIRSRLWRVDERTARQAETLIGAASRGGRAYIGINWRYESKRPPERVNRAFLIRVLPGMDDLAANWSVGKLWCPAAAAASPESHELRRVAGGWAWAWVGGKGA